MDSQTTPLRAHDVVIGCVTEDNPKFLAQVLRLVQSIRGFAGALAQSRIVVGAVERIDAHVRRELEALGAQVQIVPRFYPRNGSANRLQLFEHFKDAPESHILMLDCDTIMVQDPLPLLQRDVFHSKIAPFPTVTHAVFQRLFAHFDLPLPARNHRTGYDHTPTIAYFNAGVFLLPVTMVEVLVPVWRRYNAVLAGNPELVAPCQKHLHQAALALALAETGVATATMGAELNYQLNATHVAAPPGYADIDPVIIHYHHLAGDDGLLLPVKFPLAQRRIDAFHQRLLTERSQRLGLQGAPVIARKAPKQIAVLGMHRSGTSLVTRLLHAMGCYAGAQADFPPPNLFNPDGYWERLDVWALDQEILAALDASWLEPDRVDLARLDESQRGAFAERAQALIHKLDEHGSWVVKDPRLSLLFAFWRPLLQRPLAVLVWREPLAVAHSLHRRDALPLTVGLAVWEAYTYAMLESTLGLPRVQVRYEDLIADPEAAVTRLHADLLAAGATDLQLPDAADIQRIVDPVLNRSATVDTSVLSIDQLHVRAALHSGAALGWSTVPALTAATTGLLQMVSQQRRDHAVLQQRSAELDALLDAVLRSRSWKLGFGLTRLLRWFVPSTADTVLARLERLRKNR